MVELACFLFVFLIFINVVVFFWRLLFSPSVNDIKDKLYEAEQVRLWREYQWHEYKRKQYWDDVAAFHAQQAQHVHKDGDK